MKVTTALIQPFMLNRVTRELEAIEGFSGMTIAETCRSGRRRNLHEQHALQIGESKEKACIEIVRPDEKAQQILETLVGTARTGNSDDEKVFVWPVESDSDDRTSEIDEGRADVTLTLLLFRDFRVFRLDRTGNQESGDQGARSSYNYRTKTERGGKPPCRANERSAERRFCLGTQY